MVVIYRTRKDSCENARVLLLLDRMTSKAYTVMKA